MENNGKPMSVLAAVKDFFGYGAGQSLTQFSAEVKALSPEDREYFTVRLRGIGYNIA